MSKKLTIEEMKELAQKRGGECLSEVYLTNKSKLTWKCSEGHQWNAIPNSVNRGGWCPICSRLEDIKRCKKRRLNIDDMHALASAKGGKCLSHIYVDSSTKMKWQCSEGHIWETAPNNIKSQNQWCPRCAGVQKSTIEQMRKIAQSHGGKCLSDVYVNSHVKLEWECAKGHVWEAKPHTIKRSRATWCPKCARENAGSSQRLTIHVAQNRARDKGGFCLSETYKNSQSKLKWKCAEGHIWEAPLSDITQDHWCPECAKCKKRTIEDMKQLAVSRGGKCLSLKYKDNKQSLKWKCAEGHIWKARPNNIKSGSWCPYCNVGNINEEKCRYIIGKLSNKKFNRNRSILEGYELDGYCSELNLAFEYQGEQHYKFIPFFHKDENQFNDRKSIDDLKEKLCGEKGIHLISVPYYEVMSDERLVNFFANKLASLNLDITDPKSLNFNSFYKKYTLLEEFKKIAEEKGGKCLSKSYISLHSKLIFQCARGHKWETSGATIKHNNSWCPTCKGLKKLTIEEMQQIASFRGGKCLSDTYVNSYTKLTWQCSRGHNWEAKPMQIKHQKTWCPECWKISTSNVSKEDPMIKTLNLLAKARGGRCLASEYKNLKEKVLWECKFGHQWLASISNVKHRKSWCPTCSQTKKKNIEEMRMIAGTHGGKCLSNQYIDAHTKLLWECRHGHSWEAKPNSVISKNTWCPYCSSTNKLNLEHFRNIARSRGGKCLSMIYVNGRSKMEWECEKGHRWFAEPNSVKQGRWCGYCSKRVKLSLDDMKSIALSKQGQCLSDTYTNNKTELLWKCNKGHQWMARPDQIIQGSWCRVCSGSQKLTIQEMRELAKQRGGKCLTRAYINTNTKLQWECSVGHQWEAVPKSIKKGHWCPFCSKKRKEEIS